jgi:3-deoxy-D-manno-octulosonate 8-phosphate phosphatase (KDO 8-P phosphatase)
LSGGNRKPEVLAHVELVVFDIDGVLTDGRLYFGSRGEALKVFHVRDGHGMKLLLHAGLEIAIISGRRSTAVSARMRELGVQRVVQGCGDKVAAMGAIARSAHVPLSRCACLVDDTPDLPLMASVVFAAAVADAHPLVRRAAAWVSRSKGGHGAAREFCDAILLARSRSG